MAIFEAISNALHTKGNEEKIGQGVNYFSAVDGGIVILCT
jgi:hypothetical protein